LWRRRAGAVLLFDEGDDFFGTRTEVRGRHDRYASLEVDYLLKYPALRLRQGGKPFEQLERPAFGAADRRYEVSAAKRTSSTDAKQL
jgi:hypothetical protein